MAAAKSANRESFGGQEPLRSVGPSVPEERRRQEEGTNAVEDHVESPVRLASDPSNKEQTVQVRAKALFERLQSAEQKSRNEQLIEMYELLDGPEQERVMSEMREVLYMLRYEHDERFVSDMFDFFGLCHNSRLDHRSTMSHLDIIAVLDAYDRVGLEHSQMKVTFLNKCRSFDKEELRIAESMREDRGHIIRNMVDSNTGTQELGARQLIQNAYEDPEFGKLVLREYLASRAGSYEGLLAKAMNDDLTDIERRRCTRNIVNELLGDNDQNVRIAAAITLQRTQESRLKIPEYVELLDEPSSRSDAKRYLIRALTDSNCWEAILLECKYALPRASIETQIILEEIIDRIVKLRVQIEAEAKRP